MNCKKIIVKPDKSVPHCITWKWSRIHFCIDIAVLHEFKWISSWQWWDWLIKEWFKISNLSEKVHIFLNLIYIVVQKQEFFLVLKYEMNARGRISLDLMVCCKGMVVPSYQNTFIDRRNSTTTISWFALRIWLDTKLNYVISCKHTFQSESFGMICCRKSR